MTAVLPLVLQALLAQAAAAAELLDVRVGQHATFTRVVFELDDAAEYQVEPLFPGRLAVALTAKAKPRRVRSSSELVKAVVMEPTDAGVVATIELNVERVSVRHGVLWDPMRLVLDLTQE
jgi:hypothetical protein